MIIASAQIKPDDHNVESNIEIHCRFIELAAKHAVRLIVFPEMSLTGYQRELATSMAFVENDLRLGPLRKLAQAQNIIVVAGAPVRIGDELYIGSFVLMPDSRVLIYTKQYLHSGEEKFFSPCFDLDPSIDLEDELVSFAVCADISNPDHAKNAAGKNTTLYVASIFYTSGGIAEGYAQLGSYSKKYGMNTLVSNYCGHSWGLEAGGKSAFWDSHGNLCGNLDEKNESLLIVNLTNNETKIINGN